MRPTHGSYYEPNPPRRASPGQSKVTPVILRSFWSLLLVSSAIELLTFYRPSLPCSNSTLCLLVDLVLQTALLLGLPVMWLKLVQHGRMVDVGLTLASPRSWIRWLLPLAAVALPLVFVATRIPSIHAAYPRLAQARSEPWLLVPSTVAFAGYGLAWEFFFRGFLLFGLKAHVHRWSIVLQAIPCALMHIGKPSLEGLASFPAALLFGAIAYRTGSIVPGWLLHVSVALVINLGCVFWPL
jgi:uncharacterized protein